MQSHPMGYTIITVHCERLKRDIWKNRMSWRIGRPAPQYSPLSPLAPPVAQIALFTHLLASSKYLRVSRLRGKRSKLDPTHSFYDATEHSQGPTSSSSHPYPFQSVVSSA